MKKLIDLLKESLKERESPLSSEEEKYARKIKPALKAMIKKYGKEKGEKYFYATVRKRTK